MIRKGAERGLLLVIVSFTITVVGTRWYLQATGYPQIGGGELHVAHMLWGGLLLVIAALLALVVDARWVPTVGAILTGVGTGLFIDEVGKFITASNDYFYPLAAPLIYGLLLALILVFLVLRRRDDASPVVETPSRLATWETAHLPRRRYRRILVALLVVFGLLWVASLAIFLLIDTQTLQGLIDVVVKVPGDRVERPSEPLFYILEAAVLGIGGALLLVAAIALGRARDGVGTTIATIGLVVALTAGDLLSLYVEQISAIASTLVHGALLLGVVHYRNRFLREAPAATGAPAAPGAPDAIGAATG
jgi:hypothetical protein